MGSSELTYSEATATLRGRTGIVIPSYFAADTDPDEAAALLGDTAGAFVQAIGDPTRVCVAVDGDGPAVAAARTVQARTGVLAEFSTPNRGKLVAVQAGMRRLLADDRLAFLGVADQDGDHFANELLSFVRAAHHAEAACATDRVLVLGRRASRHRPMGLARGDLEDLADRVLLDALAYHAAVSGQPLNLQFVTVFDEAPDYHSGYKLFSRPVAEAVFTPPPPLAGLAEDAACRHACEAVMCVESHLAGALLVEVHRSTYDEQPISQFGRLQRQQLIADKMVWPCRRLGVPPAFVRQWLDNHLPRLLLGTLVPQGRDELLDIRQRVLSGVGLDPVAAPPPLIRPRFV
jgi:hypothetical protein